MKLIRLSIRITVVICLCISGIITFSSWNYTNNPSKVNIKSVENIIEVEKAFLTSIAMLDPTSCFAVDDVTNHLIEIDRITGDQIDYGSINASSLEAIITSINGDIIYGANANTWGSIDFTSGTFNTIGTFGSGNGDQGLLNFDDVDGLAFELTTGIYYGALREGDGSAPEDVLFKFDPLTGAVIQNGFGTDEYVSIQAITYNGSTYYDIDDISLDPTSGTMYGIANKGTGINLLVEINKLDGSTTLVAKIDNSSGTFSGDIEGLSVYNDGTFYFSTGGTPGKFYSLDVSTGLIISEIGQFTVGGDYEGLACLTLGFITAINDVSENNLFGSTVSINILSNDFTNIDNQPINPIDVIIDLDPNTTGNQNTLVVSGEGTWTNSNGIVSFVPLVTFEGVPTPINYTITQISSGAESNALITIDYVNCDTNDANSNIIFGTVYSDNNVNLAFDTNENGYENITVELFEDFDQNNVPDDSAILTTSTNPLGDYDFILTDLIFSGDGSYNQTISNGCNDAKDGDNNNNDLDLGQNKDHGVRFEGITIPSGAIITNARLYFTANQKKNGSNSSVNIYGNDVANPDDYCVNSDVDNRPKTTNVVSWSLPNNWEKNQEYSTPNIASLITELTNSYSYNNGNISLILIGTGSKKKRAYTFEGSNSQAPRLLIDYTVSGNSEYTYLISTNSNSYPAGSQLTTDNIEIATFTELGSVKCGNNFGLNEPPVAINNEALDNTAYSTITDLNLVSNDTDPNNNLLINTVSLDPSKVAGGVGTDNDNDGDIDQVVGDDGTWVIDENGLLSFTPDQNLIGNPDIIEYTIDDLAGLTSNSATVTITYVFNNPITGDDANTVAAAPETNVVINAVNNDSDVDGDLNVSTINFDAASAGGTGFDTDNDGDIDSVYVSGQGSWVANENGEVEFMPESGFNDDPSPIDYIISDKTDLQSNVSTISVDYIPIATNDLSTGNTTNNNVTVDVLSNDTDGDLVDATTVSLELTDLPADATCSATDAQGDCIEITLSGQGVYSVNETTGAITFDPQDGFTANPDPITYTVEDLEGNPTSALLTIEFDVQFPTATDNESLANTAGNVTQQVVTEDDGDGVDNDPDGALTLGSVDLDPSSTGIQSSLIVAGEGTWSVDDAGNVTFAPIAGFTNDPTPIDYTINDNDGNISNIATITLDYVPVATADLSTGNTTNNGITVDVLANDTDSDLVDATTVSLESTGLPVDATCSATDASGDCIEVTVPGQGVYSVNETTGAITFDPEAGFTANPDPITYTVEDHESNPASAILTIEFDVQAPTATDNESLTNTAGNVTQQVVTEDDGDGTDDDPDGSLTLTSVDLDPANVGIQSLLMVAGQGTWTVDGAGNVTFDPIDGFTFDPTLIEYTINDNDGNTSNTATIIVDYVPVSTADLSTGNTTNYDVTVIVLANDTEGDLVNPESVTLELNSLPLDAICSETDGSGDCIEVTIPGQGVYLVNEASGAITFYPEAGFTADPVPITYTVEDLEGNPTSALLTIDYLNTTSAKDDINQTTVDVPIGGNVLTNDIDPQGDSQTITLIDTDENGVPDTTPTPGTPQDIGNGTLDIDPVTGYYTFTPDPGFVGTVEIEYAVCDDGIPVTCTTATLVIDVTGPDPNGEYPPIALDDNAITEPDINVDISILGNDSDIDGSIDSTSVSLDGTKPGLPIGTSCTLTGVDGDCIQVTVPGEGVYTVDEITGIVTFDPNPTFTGETTPLPYTVCDDNSPTPLCTNAEITVTIGDPTVNEMTAEDDANIGFAGETLTGNILANDIDPDGSTGIATVSLPMADTNGDGVLDALTIATPTVIYGADPDNPGNHIVAGTLIVNVDGTYSFDSHPDFVGTVYLPYTACDNDAMNACDQATLYLTTAPFCTVIDVVVLLEGPYQQASFDMTTYLNDYHLLPGQDPTQSSNIGAQLYGIAAPLGQPYNEAPWNYAGTEGDNYGDGNGKIAYPATVTDWVLVSIRDNFNSSLPIWQCAALLHNDGTVTFPEDCPCLETVSTEDYFIVIEHRNHLSVMSQAVSPVNGVLAFDFTTNDSWKLNIGSPQEVTQKNIGGTFVMYAGSSNQTDGRTDLNSFDNSIWIQDNGNIFQYLKGDHLMDADVNSFDRAIWIINNGQFQLIPY